MASFRFLPSRRWRAGLLACGIAALLSACGGGGGGGGDTGTPGGDEPQPDPLVLRGSTPAEGATGVDRGAHPELTLSRSVAADAVHLACAGQPLAAQVTGGTTVQVTPTERLLPLATCQVQVAGGPALTFTTADGAWDAAGQAMENGPAHAQYPTVALGPQGRAIAAWQHLLDNNAGVTVQVSFYTPGSGWSTPEDLGDGSLPQVAVDAAGRALLVWYRRVRDGERSEWAAFTSRYTPGAGWSAAQRLDVPGTSVDYIQLAMNAEGDAVLTWMQDDPDGNFANIYANRHRADTGWQGPQLLEQLGQAATEPKAAVGPGGIATVVWRQGDGNGDVYASQSGRSGGWSTPVTLDTSTEHASEPAVVALADGSFMAHWTQLGTFFHAWASRFQPGSGWEAPRRVDAAPGNSIGTMVAADAAGRVLAVWMQDGTTAGGLWSSRYLAGTGWDTPVRIVDGTGSPERPQLALDAAGNALVVWNRQQATGGSSPHASRRPAGGSWSPAQRLGGPEVVDANGQALAVGASGSAMALWHQYDGTRFSLRFSRFD